MAQTAAHSQVLTLDDAAAYLKLPAESVARRAAEGEIPGRLVEGAWRFLLSALEDWLRHVDPRTVLLRQAGALREDDSLEELLAEIYRARGRPETETDSAEPCTSSTPTP
jgi:hypothetical protein